MTTVTGSNSKKHDALLKKILKEANDPKKKAEARRKAAEAEAQQSENDQKLAELRQQLIQAEQERNQFNNQVVESRRLGDKQLATSRTQEKTDLIGQLSQACWDLGDAGATGVDIFSRSKISVLA